ncbi:hypothetical protein BN938_1175 [Mucinivorans hirudinis]|uniref:Carrier domain-containing protein n=1 Tax=Mucinivorans hirudinis TaxID=1433126 RepID=A0A060RCV2_9BACT|nr:hypothetical protein BN938_1175 [Mucinivorans hirudinis]
MLEKVITFVAKAYKIDPATLSRHTDFIKDLALDSMKLVESIVEIEDAYNIEIPEKKLFKMKTLGDLADYLEATLSPAVKTAAI